MRAGPSRRSPTSASSLCPSTWSGHPRECSLWTRRCTIPDQRYAWGESCSYIKEACNGAASPQEIYRCEAQLCAHHMLC